MNESTARANGQAPVERLTDRFADEMLRSMVAREVTRQLEPPARRRWALNDYLEIAYTVAWWAGLFTLGFVLGGGR